MPTIVKCPNPGCGSACSVGDGLTNQAVRCPRCGKPFVPSSVSATIAVDATLVGRYQTRTKLGAGAFGTVYRAYDPQLDREVALKLLKPEALSSPKAVERFQREARAAAKMLHPNIVPVYDAGTHGDSHYIASALIAGKTLADLIPEGGIEPARAAALALQLAEALAYAHQQNVLHRDVKPANVLVDGRDHLYLMDFGLAGSIQQERNRMTRFGAVMGTPSYMSPEQAAGDTPNVGAAADQYGAGVVLYEMLTGRTPFEGPPDVVLFNVLKTPPKPPSAYRPGTDRRLEAICLKAMAKKPAERYPNTAALAAALRAWLAENPPTTVVAGGSKPRPAREEGTVAAPEWATQTVATPGQKSSLARTASRTAADDATLAADVPRRTDRRSRLRLWSVVVGVILAGAGIAYFSLRDKRSDPAPDTTADAGKKTAGHGETTNETDGKKPDGIADPPVVAAGAEAELLWRKGADRGDKDAQFQLGLAYHEGKHGVKQDMATAARWFKPAAAQGHTDASAYLGWHYFHGKGIERDLARAVQFSTFASDHGSAWAPRTLGEIYRGGGPGQAKDEKKAREYFQLAVDRGDAQAHYSLGECFASGIGGPRNLAAAKKWWAKGAALGDERSKAALDSATTRTGNSEAERLWLKDALAGDPEAQFQLGWFHFFGGKGLTPNEPEGFAWYLKAATNGHAQAMSQAGWCYRNGRGVERNLPESVRLLTKAANLGSSHAQQNLGWSYETGQGVPQSFDKAAELYEKAAKQNDAWGRFLLGNCYADGKGKPIDHKKAVELWELAAPDLPDAKKALEAYRAAGNKIEPTAVRLFRADAEKGNTDAQVRLGYAYLYGTEGVTKDYKEAVKWLQIAADHDSGEAFAQLGFCYLNGFGVPLNKAKGLDHYLRGANKGSALGINGAAWCYTTGQGTAKDETKALEWYRKGADAGDSVSQYEAGVRLLEGRGGPKDRDAGVKYLTKSAAQGNADAKKVLESLKP